MRKRFPVILLAAAIGCTQGEVPESAPEGTVQANGSPDIAASMSLPDPSATVVQFYCPGMT